MTTRLRKLLIAGAGLMLASTALLGPGVHADSQPVADNLKISSEGEAYVLRVEYEIPLPAGTGSVGYVSGEARRSSGGDNSKGLAGAPSHMDLVVGGTLASPWDNLESTGIKPPYPVNNHVPETECFYPGHLVDTKIVYPTDMRAELAGVPPVSTATAHCAAGPEVELHASSVAAGTPGSATEALGALVQSGAVGSDALMRPVEGVVRAEVNAHADAISILGGVVKVGSIVAHGASATKGVPGTATSIADVALHDVEVAGQHFSVANDQLILAGTSVPLVSDQADAFFKTVNAGLAGTGCTLGVLTSPERYPQGFIFARPAPKIAVDANGSYAGSMHAGLLAVCDIPEAVATQTPFSPQRAQIVLGFAYSSVEALAEPGGFGLGNLGDFTRTLLEPLPEFAVPSLPDVAGLTVPAFDAEPAPAVATPTAPATHAAPATRTIATFHPLRVATRWSLLLFGLLVLAALTHIGVTRLRTVLDRP